MAVTPTDYPVLTFRDQAEWSEWLAQNHASERGVWVKLGKVGSGVESVSRDEALDLALCYGWIDGQGRRFDAVTWLQKFTPRGKRSVWSKKNRENIQRLIAGGAMQPAGQAAVDAAKADGRWDRAYDSPATMEVPDDLLAALAPYPEATGTFESLNASNRYAILHRLQTAIRPETRARRLERFVAKLRRGEKSYP